MLDYLEDHGECAVVSTYESWWLWHCNGATPPAIARYEEGIELAGALMPWQDEDALRLLLFWRRTEPIADDYTVFVHVVDAGGRMVGQWDQVPAGDTAPTSSWPDDGVILDEYNIPLSLDGSSGPLRPSRPWPNSARSRREAKLRGANPALRLGTEMLTATAVPPVSGSCAA